MTGGSLPASNAGGDADNAGDADMEGKAGGLSLMGGMILSSTGRVKLLAGAGRDAVTTLQRLPRTVAMLHK